MSEPIVTASVSALATWTFTSCEATALPAPLSRALARPLMVSTVTPPAVAFSARLVTA